MHHALSITPSTCEPLTRDEAKAWLRLSPDQSEDEPIIDALITACRKKIEGRTQRLFYQSTCALHLDTFPDESTGVIKVPVMPLVSVGSITSYASDDTATVMSSSAYTVDTVSEPGRIALKSGNWPANLRTIDGGIVALTAGYSTSTGNGSTSLPAACAPMASAVQLLLAHVYHNRSAVVVEAGTASIQELPLGVEYLLSDLISPEVGA